MVFQTVVVAIFLCLGLILSLHFVLLKPILVIRDAVSRFADKDFSSRSSLQSGGELGELSQHFNSMAETIQSYSDSLEQTIKERTAELVKKNEIILLEKEVSEAATQAKTQLLIEQQALIKKLEDAQGQLLQSEKMASVGQLAAGVAHEINNPIGFINSNLGTLKGQVRDLLSVIAVYESAETALSGHLDLLEAIKQAKSAADLDFLQGDIQSLIEESLEGVCRVKKIVDNLKDFSRVDTAEWQYANLERGLESTLNIVWNEIKYKAEVIKEYAGLPDIECIASQINQVYLNLLVNASHAIEERGTITLRTGFDEDEVWVEIEDTGKGIKPEHLGRVFEPFFTTKPVGKGTGLGLSLAYGIVQRHHGRLDVRSEVDKGTVFRVTLPRARVCTDKQE
ncbi:MAG: ATP-binding protein [Betaproteobacteria bacterium]